MYKPREHNEEQAIAGMTRRGALKLTAAAVAMPLFSKVPDSTQVAAASLPRKQVAKNRTEWLQYAGDKASTKYSPLGQITAENFTRREDLADAAFPDQTGGVRSAKRHGR